MKLFQPDAFISGTVFILQMSLTQKCGIVNNRYLVQMSWQTFVNRLLYTMIGLILFEVFNLLCNNRVCRITTVSSMAPCLTT